MLKTENYPTQKVGRSLTHTQRRTATPYWQYP